MNRLGFLKKFIITVVIIVAVTNIVYLLEWMEEEIPEDDFSNPIFKSLHKKEFLEELLKETPENIGRNYPIKKVQEAPIKKTESKQSKTKPAHKTTSNQKLEKYKTILLWSERFHRKDWDMPGIQSTLLTKCPENRCKLVFRKDANDAIITTYDAVLFHYPDFETFKPFPSRRGRKQIYAIVSEGAPQSYLRQHVTKFKNFFNYTISYRLDADSIWPYAIMREKGTNQVVAPSLYVNWRPIDEKFYDENLIKLTKGKSRDLIAVMSNCQAKSNRDKVIESLRKFVGVDVYGKCGNFRCDLNNATCLSNIDQKYRFYASFEDSYCKDYVTEKVFKVLQRNLIPLIFGGANYKYFLPPKSYINIADFKSINELVKYLKFLTDNPKEYIKYFWWKRYYEVEYFNERFCQLCNFLHQDKRNEKVYGNIERWLMDDNVCDYFPVIKN